MDCQDFIKITEFSNKEHDDSVRVDADVIPPIKYCPFCGGENVKLINQVPHCYDCRCTFFVNFLRYLRKARKQKVV